MRSVSAISTRTTLPEYYFEAETRAWRHPAFLIYKDVLISAFSQGRSKTQ